MDPVQTRALSALEQFLLLSKSANSPRAAADLITQATSARDTFVFAELLAAPTIQNLRQSAEYAGHLRLLEIFAWGVWNDYASDKTLPTLNDAQHQKLQLLSLLTLSSQPATTPSRLSYASLTPALGLSSARELEALVTAAIYRGLVTGTLDPARQLVNITSVAPLRDLAPGSVPKLRSALDGWSGRCEEVIRSLEIEIAKVKTQARQRKVDETRFEKRVESATKEIDRRTKRQIGHGHASEEEVEKDLMDVDEDANVSKVLTDKGLAKGKEKA